MLNYKFNAQKVLILKKEDADLADCRGLIK